MRHLLALLFLLTAGLAPAMAQNSTPAPTETTAPSPAPTETPAPAPTSTPGANEGGEGTAVASNAVAESGKVLIILFVLAAILESALSLFFNWRPIAALFDRRGLKPLVSFFVALAVTIGFKSSLLAHLFKGYGYTTDGADAVLMCRIIEAAVLAGGSAGVNRLLRNLGIRPIDPVAERNPTPRPQEAWIAVIHRRTNSIGPVDVEIRIGDPATAVWAIAGQVTGDAPRGAIARWLLRDPARFPQSGGYSVKPGDLISLRLAWVDASGNRHDSPEWGPFPLADRAIVDVELSL